MVKVHDDFFDKRYLDELSHKFSYEESWKADNIANRETWPYGEKGSHLLLGNVYFKRNDINHIFTSENKVSTNELINMFDRICFKLKNPLMLMEIAANLQFKSMDGTFHIDGSEDQTVFVLMLSSHLIEKNMGGEFIHGPTNTIVKYKLGRIVEFKAADPHKGLAFNKPYIPRISVKFVGCKLN